MAKKLGDLLHDIASKVVRDKFQSEHEQSQMAEKRKIEEKIRQNAKFIADFERAMNETAKRIIAKLPKKLESLAQLGETEVAYELYRFAHVSENGGVDGDLKRLKRLGVEIDSVLLRKFCDDNHLNLYIKVDDYLSLHDDYSGVGRNVFAIIFLPNIYD